MPTPHNKIGKEHTITATGKLMKNVMKRIMVSKFFTPANKSSTIMMRTNIMKTFINPSFIEAKY
jgi:hypothetical protein